MTTATDLISRSLRLLGVVGQGRRTLTANESNDGLEALNAMLDSFSLERMMVYQILQENFPITAGTADYSIGTGGDFNTARPIKVDSAFIRDGSTDLPVLIIDRDAYDSVSVKSSTSRPQYLFYDTQYPLAYIRLLYVPDASYTLFISSWQPLQRFANATEDLALPPGYERMIAYNLAIELSAEFGVDASREVIALASQSKSIIKRINAPAPILNPSEPYAIRGGTGKRNVYTG